MTLERIDKIIASQGQYSRSDVKKLISKKQVAVNGEVVKSANVKADPLTDRITVKGVTLDFKCNVYLMLNKPKGYVSATEDRDHQTVLELVPEEFAGRDIFPAGRLDRDTTGLMIITDDGALAHNILAPKKHVQKIYHVELDIPVTEEMARGFAEGVELNDGVCKEAGLEITGEYAARVTLKEGRYHQIKRMFGCYGAKVVELHRLAMGNLHLPDDLAVGECRELTEEELKLLQQL
ncbi:MAG: 16S rRNA pseudouridine(516) synthase [Firmicutes bacterium]|nr:16S rRNA pseudouridine(516) synthase [Bacillota bacterium]